MHPALNSTHSQIRPDEQLDQERQQYVDNVMRCSSSVVDELKWAYKTWNLMKKDETPSLQRFKLDPSPPPRSPAYRASPDIPSSSPSTEQECPSSFSPSPPRSKYI